MVKLLTKGESNYMGEKEKKKILIGSIILVITLILVVVGTTYAFFSLQIQNSSEPTNIEITTGEQDKITLNGGLTNYHIHLKVSDMSLDNVGKSYYGTTDTGNDYELTEELGTRELGNITVSGELVDNYVCNATLNINLEGEMQNHLQQNDLILVIKQGDTTNTYDLSDTISNPSFKFNISSSNINPIQAYLKFTNQDADQSDLAGKELNISINIDDFACSISVGKEPLEMLREHATGGEEAVTFTEEDVDGMYRYKGTATQVTNNYICFGTDDTETCLDTPKTYMYRIIGITSAKDDTLGIPANSLKIIKAIPSSESQQWNSLYKQEDCVVDGIDKCKWDDSDMKTYLNGTFYNSIKDAKPNGAYWDSIILSHSWYNVDYTSVPATEPTSSNTTASKIGLMYATDYKNSGDQNTNNWLFIKNGWSTNSSLSGNALYEWTMSRYGYHHQTSLAWHVLSAGLTFHDVRLTTTYAVRPVFYIDPNITLTGEGTTENPFIIHY